MYFSKWMYFILFLSFCVGVTLPQSSSTKEEFRTVENKAFKEGEKLTFDLNYGFVTAGIAVMEIPRIKKYPEEKLTTLYLK
ncbi:MAG: hypothetical protein M5T52_21915 [Ignavibacteriaceae bacterium]|nr:hypothetical protein [Ignavibacteriaceae bacterium]